MRKVQVGDKLVLLREYHILGPSTPAGTILTVTGVSICTSPSFIRVGDTTQCGQCCGVMDFGNGKRACMPQQFQGQTVWVLQEKQKDSPDINPWNI